MLPRMYTVHTLLLFCLLQPGAEHDVNEREIEGSDSQSINEEENGEDKEGMYYTHSVSVLLYNLRCTQLHVKAVYVHACVCMCMQFPHA